MSKTVSPLLHEDRLSALDLIRGVAVLGVLLANIPHFCGPEIPRHKMPYADQNVAAITQLVVDNKFITMLAILFGAGLGIQYFKAKQMARPFAVSYLWRQFLLYLIGLTHIALLWFGDILATYAIISVIVVVVVLLGPAFEKGFIFLGLSWCYFLVAVGLMITVLLGPEFWDKFSNEKQLEMPPGNTPVSLISGEQRFDQRFQAYFTPENSIRIYRHGTFLDQAGHRLLFHLISVCFALPFVLIAYLGACFLIGVQLVRLSVFEAHTRPGWVYSDFVTMGLYIGVPLQVLAVVLGWLDPRSRWSAFAHVVAVLPMALLYLVLLTKWNESSFLPRLQARFRAVGRMALTNYLVQSLVSVWFFNNWGLGFYGHTGLLGGLVVVVSVWVLELLWSPLWLSVFHMGPVEWFWRSVASFKPMPVFAKREMNV
ncbi:MAG: DUF418 domain-containing protein [Planctomycetia bacterium]|nr:DUF418 domain-containing protein [Planctomycetia bacterium]